MNQYVTGTIIKELRERNKMTQLQLADKLGVTYKTISKWETGKGYPDITLLEPIADAFSISVTELISGSKMCIRDRPKPVLMDDRDAIVKVTLASICSSDLHIKHGSVPRAVPGITVGHEMVGICLLYTSRCV